MTHRLMIKLLLLLLMMMMMTMMMMEKNIDWERRRRPRSKEPKVDFGQKSLLGIFPCDLDDNDEEDDVNDLIIKKTKGILSGIDDDVVIKSKTKGILLGDDNLSQLSHSGLSKKQRKARTAFRYLLLARTNTNSNTHINTHSNTPANTNTNTLA